MHRLDKAQSGSTSLRSVCSKAVTGNRESTDCYGAAFGQTKHTLWAGGWRKVGSIQLHKVPKASADWSDFSSK